MSDRLYHTLRVVYRCEPDEVGDFDAAICAIVEARGGRRQSSGYAFETRTRDLNFTFTYALDLDMALLELREPADSSRPAECNLEIIYGGGVQP